MFLAALLVAFVVPSDLGANVERLKFMAIPLALLAATVAPKRILLTIPLVAVGGFWNISALAHTARAPAPIRRTAPPTGSPRSGTCAHNLSPSYRVEAVDTIEHWPAAYLPDAGIPIVRGWYRQNDFPQNELLYDRTLAARAYESWLRGLGVRYVVLSDAPPDYSSRGEAALIRSGRSGLDGGLLELHVEGVRGAAIRSRSWSAPVTRTSSGSGRRASSSRCRRRAATASRCAGRRTGGLARLRLARGDGTVRLQATQPGLVQLGVDLNVSRGLETLTGLNPRRVCAK